MDMTSFTIDTTKKEVTGGRISSECALDVDKPYCSDIETIKEVYKFIKKKTNDDTRNASMVIEKAKELTKCATEECALKKIAQEQPSATHAVNKTISTNMKLNGPADSTKLLNNENIDKIIAQFTTRHPNLYHMHFHMLDFDVHNKPLHTIDMIKDVINKGKDTFCCVLNTDKYGNGGIHWFCIFCDFRTKGSHIDPFTIEYFNSSGNKPLKSVGEWMVRIKYKIEEIDTYNVSIVNATPIRHQIETETECGVYCLYFIHKRLNNTPISLFANRIKDSEMVEFRDELFRNRCTNPAN